MSSALILLRRLVDNRQFPSTIPWTVIKNRADILINDYESFDEAVNTDPELKSKLDELGVSYDKQNLTFGEPVEDENSDEIKQATAQANIDSSAKNAAKKAIKK